MLKIVYTNQGEQYIMFSKSFFFFRIKFEFIDVAVCDPDNETISRLCVLGNLLCDMSNVRETANYNFPVSLTVMILNFRTDRSGQTVQTQIRLLLEEHSDQDLHCLLFYKHLFDETQ